MRRLTLLAALAAVLALPAIGVSAPADPVKGPGCADITLWDPELSGPPVYRTIGGTPTVAGALTTAKASCSGTTYTVTVFDSTGTTPLGSQTFTGDGSTTLFNVSIAPTGGPQNVCIVATSERNGRVIDRAPNEGCFPLSLDVSPGGSGLN